MLRTLTMLVLMVAPLAAMLGMSCTPRPAPLPPPPPFQVLVFSRTATFRHDSIPAGIDAIRSLGKKHGFEVEATEDAGIFSDEGLRPFRIVLFLNTTGTILDDSQKEALVRHMKRGGGFVGVHAAADTEHDWPWYAGLIGAHFRSHPAVQPAEIIVEDRTHPSTRHLPARWKRTDEWYDFTRSPRGDVRVLLSLDEATYTGGAMGEDHPIAWCHEYGGGRVFYTGLGHTQESYAEPEFLQHLLGGIRWTAGLP